MLQVLTILSDSFITLIGICHSGWRCCLVCFSFFHLFCFPLILMRFIKCETFDLLWLVIFLYIILLSEFLSIVTETLLTLGTYGRCEFLPVGLVFKRMLVLSALLNSLLKPLCYGNDIIIPIQNYIEDRKNKWNNCLLRNSIRTDIYLSPRDGNRQIWVGYTLI